MCEDRKVKFKLGKLDCKLAELLGSKACYQVVQIAVSGVPKGSIPRQLLFVYTNDLGNRIKYTLASLEIPD